MTAHPNSLAARDIAYYFHPATNARRHEQVGPMIIERGEGVHVFDDQGKEYIEGLAGLWSVAVGFGEERLVKAAAEQMRKLPYYHSFTHKSHPVGDRARRAAGAAWRRAMAKAHFTSSGSEANDLAIKMIWYYNNALGRPREEEDHLAPEGLSRRQHRLGSLTGPAEFPSRFRSAAAVRSGMSPARITGASASAGESEEAFATRLADELEERILARGAGDGRRVLRRAA